MNLDSIWDFFSQELQRSPHIISCSKKMIAGLPFLYIHCTLDTSTITKLLLTISQFATKGTSVQTECIFVRQDDDLFVFRHRFYVPQRKMFCCGNLCTDCIRFRKEG